MRGIYEIYIDKYVYVGQAQSIERRQREHLNYLNKGEHFNPRVQRTFDKYGLSDLGWFRVLELVPDGEALTPREQFWYDTRVAERGRRQVMNLHRPGDNPMDDPEVRERQAEAARRVAQTPEWRAKQAAAQKKAGQTRAADPEWRKNQKAAVAATLAKHYVLISPAGERVEVYNLKAFCKENGLDQANINRVLRGVFSQHKGWRRP